MIVLDKSEQSQLELKKGSTLDFHFTNRIVPYILIAVALGAHLSYCEWDFSDDLRSVSSGQHQRAIYFHHSHSHNVFLLAKSLAEKDKAQLYGVTLPLVMVAVAIGMLQLTGEKRSRHSTHARIRSVSNLDSSRR